MTSHFIRALRHHEQRRGARRWVYVPYDQLTSGCGPLSRLPSGDAGIVLVESPAKAARRPYHKQKLALVLASQRHFALEQAERGVAVRYEIDEHGYAPALERVARDTGKLVMMRPAERELRVELAPLVERGLIEEVPHEGWLSTRADFDAGAGTEPPWRMDRFYRHVRARTGILMDRGRPVGGKLSYDTENRRPWRGSPPAPPSPTFEVDAVTKEVGDLIEHRYATHPGTLRLDRIAASETQVAKVWAWVKKACLPHFGPYEDAMSTASSTLFHTQISPLMNLHRLLPWNVVQSALRLDIPLASREGFVRQILGWREFVRHVHERTDGFRDLKGSGHDPGSPARPSFLDAHEPLPAAYWGTRSGLACLDHVVEDVWSTGYSHHITRLMVLSNVATLLGVEPREVTDWFWEAYVDAYDWVVEPNVLAMGTYGVGDLMTTKPYVSGAAYIHKMSDYCGKCAFDPKKTCPITPLYWAFIARHADVLAQNHRTMVPVSALGKRAASRRAEDQRVLERVRELMTSGSVLTPDALT